MAAYIKKSVAILLRNNYNFKRLTSTTNTLQLNTQHNLPLMVIPKRCLQTTAIQHKTVAGRVKRSKGEKPVMYEEINPPYTIGLTVGWNQHQTANLDGEDYKAEAILEDMFIRRFLHGTFHNLIVSEAIIKRRANQIILTCMMLRQLPAQQYYFLIGYTEELLSHWFKCPVKMEVQIVMDKPVYKWI